MEEVKDDKLIKEMEKASKDLLFLKDINNCIVDFEDYDVKTESLDQLLE